jgi:hypothetical protein
VVTQNDLEGVEKFRASYWGEEKELAWWLILLVTISPVVPILLFWAISRIWAKCSDAVFERGFNPERLAATEVRFWRACNANNPKRMTRELAFALNREFRISHSGARGIAKPISEAICERHKGEEFHEPALFVMLLFAYEKIHFEMGGEWTPEQVAGVEMESWIMRWANGTPSETRLGAALVRLYTILTGRENDEVRQAALQRAKVLHQGDQTGAWNALEEALKESYMALERGTRE